LGIEPEAEYSYIRNVRVGSASNSFSATPDWIKSPNAQFDIVATKSSMLSVDLESWEDQLAKEQEGVTGEGPRKLQSSVAP
jgi:hypothetical protein